MTSCSLFFQSSDRYLVVVVVISMSYADKKVCNDWIVQGKKPIMQALTLVECYCVLQKLKTKCNQDVSMSQQSHWSKIEKTFTKWALLSDTSWTEIMIIPCLCNEYFYCHWDLENNFIFILFLNLFYFLIHGYHQNELLPKCNIFLFH